MESLQRKARRLTRPPTIEAAQLAIEGIGAVADAYLRKPKLRSTLDALMILLIVFGFDGLTHHMVSFRMVYLVPVWYAAQRGGRGPGLILCVATTAFLSFLDRQILGEQTLASLLNPVIRFTILTALMLLIESHESKLKRFVDLASSDPLTGVGNRSALHRSARRMNSKPKESTSVVMIDCDHFKELNDRYGHNYGDHVLIVLSRLLRRSFQPLGAVIRTGGDEFVVVAHGKRADDTHRLMERVSHKLAEATEIIGTRPSISWGVSQRTHKMESLDDLISAADRQMYKHKSLRQGLAIVEGGRANYG